MSEIIKDEAVDAEFAAAIDQMQKVRAYAGNRVKATVVAVNKTEAVVDIGIKQSGYIPAEELSANPNLTPDEVVKVGDVLSVSIDTKHHDELDYFGDALNYMARELRTLEEDERKFISNISHDFRSPLTSVKGYVEAMKDGTIPVEMQEKYFDIILFETERLTKLTTNLLDINKYGQGGLIMDISDFDINGVIKNTAATFEGACVKKHIMIDLVLTGETMLVTADMSKIQQVLYNLIDNAIKFSNENSSIKIETTDRGEKIFISVKDTGIGIPKNSINKVFERFYKTDLSRGKDKKGTGLGLAIVKEIIQAHKENINVISTEGVGTEFIFSLTKARE